MGNDTFPPDVNGAATFTERLVGGLIRRGHDVRVMAPATSRRTSGTRSELVDGVETTVYRIPSWRWYPHEWLRFSLPWMVPGHARRVLDSFQPDAIHIQSHLVMGRALAREAKARGIRLVATNHIMPENLLDFTLMPDFMNRALLSWAVRDAGTILGMADAVTTPTQLAADYLTRTTGLTGVIPISCGLNLENYLPRPGGRDRDRVLFVGRINTEKQIDVLLRAFAQISGRVTAEVVVAGDGDQREPLIHLADQLGIGDRVRFAGRVTDAELRQLYSDAAVFVMPSIAELQSIATMEAMASGLPIIAADAMALPHLVRDGENGYLFRPSDPEDLAAKLLRVLTEPLPERERMQRASLRLVAKHALSHTLDAFEALYRGERPRG
jgi:glycosyltransferase involved in cell wall biosynthesis